MSAEDAASSETDAANDMRRQEATDNRKDRDDTSREYRKVIIVGAGAAGLQCAKSLLEREPSLEAQHVIILEARPRVGGRIWTTWHKVSTSVDENQDVEREVPHDMGATWVHGTGISPARKGANDTDNDKDDDNGSKVNSALAPDEKEQDQLNPILQLLSLQPQDQQRRGIADDEDDDNSKDEDTAVIPSQFRPISPWGNPWTKVWIAHLPLSFYEASYWKRRPTLPTPRHVFLPNKAVPRAMQLFVDGTFIPMSSPAVREALTLHRRLMRAVAQVGNAAFECGQGSAVSDISLHDTIHVIRTHAPRNYGLGYRKSSPNGTHQKDENMSNNNHEDDSSLEHGRLVESLLSLYQYCLENYYGIANRTVPLYEFLGTGSNSELETVEMPGAHGLLQKGMTSVVEALLQVGSEPNKLQECIRCDQPVLQISQASNPQKNIVVQTQSGLIVEAPLCVVTIPLACLQEHLDHNNSQFFVPPLSLQKQRAIRSLQTAKYKKVLLEFKHIWWSREPHFFGLVRTKQRPALFRYLQVLNIYAHMDIPWLDLSLVGEAAAWAVDKPTQAIRRQVLLFLQDTMAPPIPLEEACTGCHVSRWEESEWSRGAYSAWTLGTRVTDVENLQHPEWSGRLIFAGEANNVGEGGSVHGALQSGVFAANQVLEFWKNTSEQWKCDGEREKKQGYGEEDNKEKAGTKDEDNKKKKEDEQGKEEKDTDDKHSG